MTPAAVFAPPYLATMTADGRDGVARMERFPPGRRAHRQGREIEVVISSSRASDGSLLVEIADRGVGMSEERLAEFKPAPDAETVPNAETVLDADPAARVR